MKTTYGFIHEEDEILSSESLGITTRAKEIIDDILHNPGLLDSTVSTVQNGMNGVNKNGYDNGGFRMKNSLGITRSLGPIKNVVGTLALSECILNEFGDYPDHLLVNTILYSNTYPNITSSQ